MRILVTGGAGFIGSHLAQLLCERGHAVTVVDREPLGKWTSASRQVIGDCREIQTRAYWGARYYDHEFVYHLASTVGVRNVLADPKEAIENIIESTRAVLSLGIPGIYFSTSEVYGRNQEDLREDSEIRLTGRARWAYAGAKLVCEWLALEAGWKVIRPFNVIGARQNMAYGAVVPTFVQAALEGKPLTVYGDGKQVRTFIDVHDFVEIVDELRDQEFDVLNVGGQHQASINELAEKVMWEFSSWHGVKHVPYAEAFPRGFEECSRRVPDLSKLDSLVSKRTPRSLSSSLFEIAKEKQCQENTMQMTR